MITTTEGEERQVLTLHKLSDCHHLSTFFYIVIKASTVSSLLPLCFVFPYLATIWLTSYS